MRQPSRSLEIRCLEFQRAIDSTLFQSSFGFTCAIGLDRLSSTNPSCRSPSTCTHVRPKRLSPVWWRHADRVPSRDSCGVTSKPSLEGMRASCWPHTKPDEGDPTGRPFLFPDAQQYDENQGDA